MAANPPQVLFGVADIQSFYTKWLVSDPMFTHLVIRNQNHEPFNGEWDSKIVPTMAFMVGVGRYLMKNQNVSPRYSATLALTCGELLAPALPATYSVAEAEARTILVDAVKALIRSPFSSSFTSASFQSYNTTIQGAATYLGARITDDEWLTGDIPYEVAILILGHIADTAVPNMVVSGVSLIAHNLCAVIKRGTVSQGFINKVQHGIQTDLNVYIALQAEAMTTFYGQYGRFINDVNIPVILTHWETLIPAQALRLRLVVQQAANSGLTSLAIIGRCIMSYQDFPWTQIFEIYPVEVTKVIAAMAAVGNNKYYGYRHNLGPVRSTLYKSIGYVAKEILVKVGGEQSLNNYAGWPRGVQFQAAVDGIIANYERYRNARITDPNQNPVRPNDAGAQTAAIIGYVTAGPDVYV